MTKSPAFQFYPVEFLHGSKLMTLAERGAYITLLCEQWDAERLTAHPQELARLLGVTRKEAERLWGIVSRKFVQREDGTWQNERLERERAKQVARREALSRNGAQGGRGHKANGKQIQSTSFNSVKANKKLDESLLSLALHDLNKERSDRTPLVPKTSDALRGRFEAFWDEYPRKKAKGDAWKVWQRLKPSPELTASMLAAVRAQRTTREWRDEGGKFVPYPATWLNQERWSDEPEIQVERDVSSVPFWDECAKCGQIHPVGQPCPEAA